LRFVKKAPSWSLFCFCMGATAHTITPVDFDFSHIAVPFRMQPGLQRLPWQQTGLTPLTNGSALHASKLALAGQCLHVAPGLDGFALREQLINTLSTELPFDWPDAASHDFWPLLALRAQEDLVLLNSAAEVQMLMVCSPSGWAPEHVLGQNFGQIHARVADSQRILMASQAIVSMLQAGPWQRWVWTLSPGPDFDRHPLRCKSPDWPGTTDAGNFGKLAWLRVEHQKLIPLRRNNGQDDSGSGIVFTIRVMLERLSDMRLSAPQATRLFQSLASMSDAVLDYKNLRGVQPLAMEWLLSNFDIGHQF
jgi:hypothetical protein